MSIENRQKGDHAVTTIDGNEVYLEDLIMNPGPDEIVIHLNGYTLDNRRANLKIVKKDAIELKLMQAGLPWSPARPGRESASGGIASSRLSF